MTAASLVARGRAEPKGQLHSAGKILRGKGLGQEVRRPLSDYLSRQFKSLRLGQYDHDYPMIGGLSPRQQFLTLIPEIATQRRFEIYQHQVGDQDRHAPLGLIQTGHQLHTKPVRLEYPREHGVQGPVGADQ